MYFGSPLSSDSTTLSSNAFEVSNIYNCNIIEVYCLNAYWFFATFLIKLLSHQHVDKYLIASKDIS